MKRLIKEFTKGIIAENPVFIILLGLCPVLAVSTSMSNAIGMGIAATFVLVGSNMMISAMRNFIPDKIRIPCFIVVIATFVIIVELVMKAFSPALSRSLGIFIPLIVVNCIVFGRAEGYAYKNNVLRSTLDGIGMGIGFTMALLIIAFIRESLGAGKIFGVMISKGYEPALYMILAPGALLTIGFLIAGLNLLRNKK